MLEPLSQLPRNLDGVQVPYQSCCSFKTVANRSPLSLISSFGLYVAPLPLTYPTTSTTIFKKSSLSVVGQKRASLSHPLPWEMPFPRIINDLSYFRSNFITGIFSSLIFFCLNVAVLQGLVRHATVHRLHRVLARAEPSCRLRQNRRHQQGNGWLWWLRQ